MTFKRYISRIEQGGFLQIEGVSPVRLARWIANEDKREKILRAREGFLANQPQLTFNPPSKVEKAVLEQNPDPDSIIFESKIVPRIEKDVLTPESAPGHFYSEATLAAINLPGWADTLWRYASADLKAFFIELGKALSTKRRLWDKKDEQILLNYYSTKKLKKPLSQMTEKDASSVVGLTESAYDRRLLRLGIRKSVGRPKKPDKTSR